jgi:hypothetical protein
MNSNRNVSRRRLAMFALLSSLAIPANGQYTPTSTKSILTQNDGLPCDPQHGSDNAFYSSGCCGSPGRRACAFVLHFGKGPWGDSPGCTEPDSNILRWNSYDSKLVCNLYDPLPALPALVSPAKPPVRDFQFFVTSDLHFYRIWYNINDQIGHPARINAMHAAAAAAGHPYAAVVVPGDLTTGPSADRLGAYRSLWEIGSLPGASINLPVYFGLGNHDISAQPDGFGTNATDGQRIWEYLDTQMATQHIDTSITGCLPNIDPLCIGFGPLSGSHNYSWDWQGVHLVMLNTWAGDTDRAYSPPLGMNGLAWLARDLNYYVGNSGRPVILFQHYTLGDAGSNAWSSQNLTDFTNIIKPYNVVGLFSGHTHSLGLYGRSNAVNQPPGQTVSGPGTVLDNFVDGSGGDCFHHGDGQYQCANAISNFLTVHLSNQYLDVTANSWQGTNPTYADSTIGFRGRNGNSNDATCRKRLTNNYIDVTSLFQLEIQNGSGKITATNKSTSALGGALAIQVADSSARLTNWDFVDSCVSGRPYLLLTEGSMAPNSPVTVAFTASGNLNSNQLKVFQLGDQLTSSNGAPVVGLSSVTLQVSSLSGDALPFTYSVDPYTSGDTTQWLHVQADQTTTPATFTLKADTLPSYAHLFASFTITPTDTNIAPLTIPVTLAPAALSVSSNVNNSLFRFDGNDTALPYNNVVAPNSTHKIDAPSPQNPSAGIRYTFKNWSIGGPAVQNLSIPPGGLNLTATFDTSYSIQRTLTPPGGGTVAITPPGAGAYYPAGDIHFKATPNPGYFFAGYSDGLTGAGPDLDFNLRAPLTFTATFAPNPALTIASSVAAAEGSTATINGITGAVPLSTIFAPDTAVTVSVPASFGSATNPGIRYQFQQWSDGVTQAQRTITTGTTARTYTAQYKAQYLVTVLANPASGGSVTGGGWGDAGVPVSVLATPAGGFKFLGFTGGLTSTANPLVFTPPSPTTLTAGFGSGGTAQLFAAQAGSATDGLLAQTQQAIRVMPLVLKNAGAGAALNAQIDSITAQVVSGTGTVSALLGAPAAVGDLVPGASANTSVNFIWPATATRVRLTVNFSANGAAYTGSTVLNLFR